MCKIHGDNVMFKISEGDDNTGMTIEENCEWFSSIFESILKEEVDMVCIQENKILLRKSCFFHYFLILTSSQVQW